MTKNILTDTTPSVDLFKIFGTAKAKIQASRLPEGTYDVIYKGLEQRQTKRGRQFFTAILEYNGQEFLDARWFPINADGTVNDVVSSIMLNDMAYLAKQLGMPEDSTINDIAAATGPVTVTVRYNTAEKDGKATTYSNVSFKLVEAAVIDDEDAEF